MGARRAGIRQGLQPAGLVAPFSGQCVTSGWLVSLCGGLYYCWDDEEVTIERAPSTDWLPAGSE